jgi:RNA polymerase sigma-70 factor, ECF subfamily
MTGQEVKYMSDEQLMEAMSKGEHAAFNELYARYAGPLALYFRRMLANDREKAEDFVHDLFAKIIKQPSYFDVSRTFKTWVFSVANNMCKNEYKRLAVRKNTTALEEHHLNIGAKHQLFEEVASREFSIAFQETLGSLDDKHKEVFELRHIAGMAVKEIAECLGINEGTVKSRLFYACRYLADKLKEYRIILDKSH